jgi:hypothetical protein
MEGRSSENEPATENNTSRNDRSLGQEVAPSIPDKIIRKPMRTPMDKTLDSNPLKDVSCCEAKGPNDEIELGLRVPQHQHIESMLHKHR